MQRRARGPAGAARRDEEGWRGGPVLVQVRLENLAGTSPPPLPPAGSGKLKPQLFPLLRPPKLLHVVMLLLEKIREGGFGEPEAVWGGAGCSPPVPGSPLPGGAPTGPGGPRCVTPAERGEEKGEDRESL